MSVRLCFLFTAVITLWLLSCTGPGNESIAGTPRWSPIFGTSSLSGPVSSVVRFGGDLVAGGDFRFGNRQILNNVGRFEGGEWRPLGNGLNGRVRALAIADGKLVAGGDFATTGPQALSGAAQFDGGAWRRMDEALNGSVHAFVEFQGSLIAAGEFTQSGDAPISHVARWTGVSWQNMGFPGTYAVTCLAATETALFAAAGGSVYRYEAFTWSKIGSFSNGAVKALLIHDGSLTAGGEFSGIVSRWDGTAWHPFGPTGQNVQTMAVFDGSLVVAGSADWDAPQAETVNMWNGSAWVPLSPAVDGIVQVLFEDEGRLVAAGDFDLFGDGRSFPGIACFDGNEWTELEQPQPDLNGANGSIAAFEFHDGKIVAGGSFTRAGTTAAGHLAGWNGTEWFPLGPGVDGPVSCLEVMGGSLYAGGHFLTGGGVVVNNVARWDGQQWQALAGGVAAVHPQYVQALQEYQGRLYMGGRFSEVGGVPAGNIAAWNGTSWESVGGGTNGIVYELTSHNGLLIAAGSFGRAGEVSVKGLAAWNGTEWLDIGADLTTPDPAHGTILGGYVYSLASFDGSLIVGGSFSRASGHHTANVARWNGQTWSGMDGLTGPFTELHAYDLGWVGALTVHDGKLYAGGSFETDLSGTTRLNNIAVWNGSAWQPMDSGTNGPVSALGTFYSALFAGGDFSETGDLPSSHVAQWGDEPVSVELASFTATREAGSVVLRWRMTADHEGPAVFHVHRSAEGRDRERLTATPTDRLEFVDTSAPAGSVQYWLQEPGRDGASTWYGPIAVEQFAPGPAQTLLDACHPNPFVSSTSVSFSLTAAQAVRLDVFDASGRKVATLHAGELPAGDHAITWGGVDDAGRPVTSGRYFLRLEGPQGVRTNSVVRVTD